MPVFKSLALQFYLNRTQNITKIETVQIATLAFCFDECWYTEATKPLAIVCLECSQSICSFQKPRNFFFFSQPSVSRVFNGFSYFHTLYSNSTYEFQSLRVCGQGRGILEVAHCFGKQCLSPPLSVDIGGRKQSSELAAQSVEEVQTQLTFIMHSKCSCILLTKFPPQLNIGCRLFIVV